MQGFAKCILLASCSHFFMDYRTILENTGLFFFQQSFMFIFFIFSLCLNIEIGHFFGNMPKAKTPFWQYDEPEDGVNRMKLHCKLCGIDMKRGLPLEIPFGNNPKT